MISGDVAHAWHPPVPGVREVFHARFRGHSYPRHAHDVWTILVVDTGDIRYALDGAPHGAGSAVVTVLPPHVVHDGRPGPAGVFVKRVLYLDDTLVDPALVGCAVDHPEVDDRDLRRSLRTVHRELVRGTDDLVAESRLALVLERLVSHLRRGRAAARDPRRPHLAEATRALLDAHVVPGISLAALADELSASRGHIVRRFTATFGIAPHAYLTGRRITRSPSAVGDV